MTAFPESSFRPSLSSAASAGGKRVGLIRAHLGHSRAVSAFKLVAGMVALGLIGLLAAWPTLHESRLGGKIRPTPGQSEILELRYFSRDKQDRPFSLLADKAVKVAGDDNQLLLTKPVLEMTQASGSWVTLSADDGHHWQDTGLLDLHNQVHVVRDDGFEFITDLAHVDTKAGTATGDHRVVGQGPSGEIDAAGFSMYDNGKTLVFHQSSSATLTGGGVQGPKPAPAPSTPAPAPKVPLVDAVPPVPVPVPVPVPALAPAVEISPSPVESVSTETFPTVVLPVQAESAPTQPAPTQPETVVSPTLDFNSAVKIVAEPAPLTPSPAIKFDAPGVAQPSAPIEGVREPPHPALLPLSGDGPTLRPGRKPAPPVVDPVSVSTPVRGGASTISPPVPPKRATVPKPAAATKPVVVPPQSSEPLLPATLVPVLVPNAGSSSGRRQRSSEGRVP
ncbi:lipopolysaccharide export system protein LptC [uncultured Gammaproteobacteria bacterium]